MNEVQFKKRIENYFKSRIRDKDDRFYGYDTNGSVLRGSDSRTLCFTWMNRNTSDMIIIRVNGNHYDILLHNVEIKLCISHIVAFLIEDIGE